MRVGGRAGALLVAFVVALAVPALAQGHATLLATQPQASGVLSQPPTQVRLTYSERIEPRFAVISVTDAGGNQEIAGSPARAADDENSIFVPVKALSQGWYLVWWRVISADGHPVRGAFTFAVGPSPGPPPQFVIPSLGESAATPSLVGSRWVLLLAMLGAIGLLAFRGVIARPLQVTGGNERALQGVTTAAAVALGVALVAAPVYLLLATAEFSLRPWSDIGEVVPLVRDSGFGRAFSDLWIVLGLLAVAAGAALALDRPGRKRRSAEALLAGTRRGRVCRGRARLPGPCGPPVDDQPRRSHARARLGASGRSVDLDRRARRPARPRGDDAGGKRFEVLAVVVPRFSRAAMGSVAVLLATGIIASIVHLPTLSSLWETSYGQALIAKSILLVCALVLGAVNTLRSRPRLVAAAQRRDQALGDNAAGLLRRLVLGEVALLAGAVVAASILTSIAPPSQALARAGKTDGKVGPRGRGSHVHARRRAHPGRRAAQPRRDRQRLLAASAARGQARAQRAHHDPSSTCST